MRTRTGWIVLALVIALGMGLVMGPGLVRRYAFAVEQGRHDAARAELLELSRHDTLSPLFRAVARTVGPAVVEVRVTRWVQQPRTGELDEFMRRFFGEEGLPPQMRDRTRPQQDEPQQQQPQQPRPEQRRYGLGSGVIVDAAGGHILTNWHVVGSADRVEVILADGRVLQAEWVRSDRMSDIAVVKVNPQGLLGVPLGDSDAVDVGDWVIAIGAPQGLSQTVTAGIISAKGRTTGRGGFEDFLQTDASINVGNSGGPLVNMRGEVIGINTAIVTRTGGSEGIGFAIPSNMARQVMSQLIEHGRVARGYVGVYIQDANQQLARSFRLPSTRGALVNEVIAGSPAERAGLQPGDFIVAVNGHDVANSNEMMHRVSAVRPGQQVRLTLYREGERIEVPLEVAERPDGEAADGGEPARPQAPQAPQRLGLEVAELTPEIARQQGYGEGAAGVVVTGVNPRSDAAEQGLRPGVLITHVEGQAVTNVQEFSDAVSAEDAADGVRLRIREPRGRSRFVFITPMDENGR